jgi:hypothetical protein
MCSCTKLICNKQAVKNFLRFSFDLPLFYPLNVSFLLTLLFSVVCFFCEHITVLAFSININKCTVG